MYSWPQAYYANLLEYSQQAPDGGVVWGEEDSSMQWFPLKCSLYLKNINLLSLWVAANSFKKTIKKNPIMQASFVLVQIQMKLSLELLGFLLPRLLSSSCRHRTAKQICLWLLPACIHLCLVFCYLKVNHLGRVTCLPLPCAMEEALLYQKAVTVGQEAKSNWQTCNNSVMFLLQPCAPMPNFLWEGGFQEIN